MNIMIIVTGQSTPSLVEKSLEMFASHERVYSRCRPLRLSPFVDQIGDKRGPASLMACPKARATIAMKVFVEE